ncbi:hypothetical protein PAECIP112173_00380 [Paenibacillus sp. JJ-100]|uniref:hypothetical protein n=1 Tax=Paenibacillus sp. JJ-100 TaxID=2974896 RepID=UPI0022FFA922|nr:hypothetical protein [Paenibacillus sp. JJ-100]CAI6024361.1 hypothetical protein PAECIP112173_00380 [Paenibacillus sp. JJ-100]
MKSTNYKRHLKYYFQHSDEIKCVSRKTKKFILGKKLNKRKLKERLADVVITENPYPEPATISDDFCPKCGCESAKHTGNMSSYPEVWSQSYCIRCGFLLGEADNSRWYSALEFPEHNYELH